MLENDYEESIDQKQMEESKKKTLAMKKYYGNEYNLENQALRTGFGKMVRAINQTNPKYSFGKEKRFFSVDKTDDLPYEHRKLANQKYGNINIGYHDIISKKNKGHNYTRLFNKNEKYNIGENPLQDTLNNMNFVSNCNNATDFYYCPPPPHYYKYNKSPQWKFSKSTRIVYDDANKYQHYNLPYDKNTDNEKINKKWRNRIIGGDIGLNERFSENKEYFEKSTLPGPGRYNPKDIYFKYRSSPGGYMGMKLDHCTPICKKKLTKEVNDCLSSNDFLKKSINEAKNMKLNGGFRFNFANDKNINDSEYRSYFEKSKKLNTIDYK